MASATSYGPPHKGAARTEGVRRRPTLPHAPACSTIGAEGLNFQVRNGAGCFPFAMVAETLLRCDGRCVGTSSRPYLGNRTVDANIRKQSVERRQALGLLVPVGSCITAFHLWPINPVFCWGPYPVDPVRNLILKRASRLDAFSGYHFRT